MSDGAVRLLTIAPEVEGIDAVIKVAQARGVTVAMGHSDATMVNRARSGSFRNLLRRPHVQRDARTGITGIQVSQAPCWLTIGFGPKSSPMGYMSIPHSSASLRDPRDENVSCW